jgi:hypothetical protein
MPGLTSPRAKSSEAMDFIIHLLENLHTSAPLKVPKQIEQSPCLGKVDEATAVDEHPIGCSNDKHGNR